MKYSICNVRDFGALGDGSANDAPALQAALDSGAATVYIPAGAYRIGDTLRVHSDTHILCDGRARLFLCEKKPKKRGDFLRQPEYHRDGRHLGRQLRRQEQQQAR